MTFITPRKVTKAVYNAYTDTDYTSFSTNLNPLNPTSLEMQYNNMVKEVRVRVQNIYIQNNISIDDKEVFSVDTPSIEAVSDALDDIMNRMKLAENPLMELIDNGLPYNATPTVPMDWIVNPPTLDCEGVETSGFTGSITSPGPINSTEDSSGDHEGEEDTLTNTNTDVNNITYTITYNNTEKLKKDTWGPTTYTKDLKTLEFKVGVVTDDVYTFSGWYLDRLFSEKVPNNKMTNPRRNLQLYAHVVRAEDSDNGLDTQVIAGNKPFVGLEDNKCDIREMSWLKIILMILRICKIIIKVLVLVYNISRAAAEIAKDAELCWINPPSLMSLISYTMQRVSAIIFQLFGKLLLYLWSLLNLDCLSVRTTEIINEINALLAGVSNTIAGVDVAAVTLSGGELQAEWAAAMKELKQKAIEAKDEFKDQWKNVGSQLIGSFDETGLGQLKDAFVKDPWGFLADNAIPDNIKSQIMDMYDTIQSSKDIVTTISNQVRSMSKPKQSKQGEGKKGLTVEQVN